MSMARVLPLSMTAPSPWLFKQRALSGLLGQELAFFATLLSGSRDRGPPPRKKKHVREHPSKRGQNRKTQQEKKKEHQRQQRHPKQEPERAHQDRKEKGAPKAEQDGAKKVLKNVGLVEMKGPMFAPLQRRLEDIPIIQLDIKKDGLHKRFQEVTKRRHNRAKDISPGRFYNVPVTPHPNPSNPPCGFGPFPKFGHSHHRIELLDSVEGEGMLVQLLIRDFDLYLVAFRRFMPDKNWSKWYYFNDLELPDFLAKDSVSLGIGGSHKECYEFGGHESFRLVFTEFAAYPETLGKETFREPALIAVFLFCESFRDRWMHMELLMRIKFDIKPRPVGYYMLDGKTGLERYIGHLIIWKRLHSWSIFCRLCIKAGTEDGGLFDEEEEMNTFGVTYQLTCFEEMIGKKSGLLLVLKRDDEFLTLSKEDRDKPGAGLECSEPGFDNIKDRPLIFYDAYGKVIPKVEKSLS